MEFIVTSTDKSTNTPAMNREVLHLFGHWQPPEGVNLKGLYFSVDGRRSFGLLEADNAGAIAELTNAFMDYLEFEVYPVVTSEEGAQIMAQRQEWVDHTKGH